MNVSVSIKFVNAKLDINSIYQRTRRLESRKLSIKTYNALLLPFFVLKLNHKLIRDWEPKIAILPKEKLTTYKEFRKFMLLIKDISDITKELCKTNSHNSSHLKFRSNAFSITN